MKLSESNQYSLMNFIQTIIKDKKELGDENINENEIAELRRSNDLLVAQLGKLELDLETVIEEKKELVKKNEEIALEKLDLENSLSTTTHRFSTENLDAFYKIEKQLIEKNSLLEITKQMLEKSRHSYEKEILQYKEELDASKVKSHKFHRFMIKFEKMKEKLEKMSGLKKKYKELKATNESMQQLIKQHQREANSCLKAKTKNSLLKESLKQEKSKILIMIQNLETKDQLIVKFNSDIRKMQERIMYLENQVTEQYRSIASSVVSDDELHLNRLETPMESGSIFLGIQPLVSDSGHDKKGYYFNSQSIQKVKLLRKKEKVHRLQESLQMQKEEFRENKFIDFHIIEQLKEWNKGLEHNVQLLSEKISADEVEKVEHGGYKVKLDNALHKNEELSSQIEKLQKENGNLLNRCVEAREQAIELSKKVGLIQVGNQDTLADKDSINKRKASLEQITEDTIYASIEKQCTIENEEVIKNTLQLKQEILLLKLQNKELQDLLQLSVSTKNQTISLLEMNHKDEIERIKSEAAVQSEKMVEDTHLALERVHSHHDELHSRLRSERKSTQMGFNRALILNKHNFTQVDEVNNVKQQLASVLKENEKLNRDYHEVVLCWKDSNKMLRLLQRAMDNESKRMQGAVNHQKALRMT